MKKITELKDTVELMNSRDFRERFRAEYHQTAIRYRKLVELINGSELGTLTFKPICPLELLRRQADVMKEYLRMLERRAEIEGVKLLGGGKQDER